VIRKKENNRILKSKVHKTDQYQQVRVIKEYLFEEEDEGHVQMMYENLEQSMMSKGFNGGNLSSPKVGGSPDDVMRTTSQQKARTLVDIQEDESTLLREELLMNLNGQASANSPNPGPVPYESILFYDEHIEDDSYNFELIDELFLNSKRKTIKIAKEGILRNQLNDPNVANEVNNFSRINTDEGDESDSSI